MEVSWNEGTPRKWMLDFMENPSMDDDWGTPMTQETPMWGSTKISLHLESHHSFGRCPIGKSWELIYTLHVISFIEISPKNRPTISSRHEVFLTCGQKKPVAMNRGKTQENRHIGMPPGHRGTSQEKIVKYTSAVIRSTVMGC